MSRSSYSRVPLSETDSPAGLIDSTSTTAASGSSAAASSASSTTNTSSSPVSSSVAVAVAPTSSSSSSSSSSSTSASSSSPSGPSDSSVPPFPVSTAVNNNNQLHHRSGTRNNAVRTNQDLENRKREHRNRVEECSTKVQAFLWVVATVLMCYSTNLPNVIFHDERVHRGWFNLGLFCFGIMIAMLLYATVWIPYVKKITYDIEVVSPRFVPTAAIVFILQGICFCVGLWPVFGLFTPGVLLLVFMGTLMSTHFIPYI